MCPRSAQAAILLCLHTYRIPLSASIRYTYSYLRLQVSSLLFRACIRLYPYAWFCLSDLRCCMAGELLYKVCPAMEIDEKAFVFVLLREESIL